MVKILLFADQCSADELTDQVRVFGDRGCIIHHACGLMMSANSVNSTNSPKEIRVLGQEKVQPAVEIFSLASGSFFL